MASFILNSFYFKNYVLATIMFDYISNTHKKNKTKVNEIH